MKILALLMTIVGPGLCLAQQTLERDDYFEAHVRPLLSQRCYDCHRRKAEAGLRLDSLAGMQQGGKSGPAIVVGDAKNSLLWNVVTGRHPKVSMPPDDPLSKEEAEILERWISDGAHWPNNPTAPRSNPDSYGITSEEREFWSFQPIARAEIPTINGPWGAHPIDALIAEKHLKNGVSPTTELTPRKLARRVYYDLTGLPPMPDDLAEFEAAWKLNPQLAWRHLVDRLLATPDYGERWAQHWLDLVRYADTAGDAADYPIPEAFRYRNYVIDAFNEDKPYDQFVREQIAGDSMSSEDADESWQRRIATGYIAISRRIGVSPQDLPHITIEDTLDNLGKTFLGLSIGCARCHDHKFDPIPTADYYSLYGIFHSTVYPHVGAEHRPYRSDFVYRIGESEANKLLEPYRAKLKPLLKAERAAFERYKDFQRMPVNIPGYTRDVAWQEVLSLREQIRQMAETFPNLETAFAVSEGVGEDAYIQKQGEPKGKGPLVARGFLQILGGETLAENSKQSGRLELAKWITDRDNPLTARVIVNRIWHHHFGQGIVTTTSDFGVRGTKPSHPELLDFLANYLIDHDWSIKQLHRLILSSQTYRLAAHNSSEKSNIDPENALLWRGNRRPLDAEQIRDSILAFGGQLDRSRGCRHPFPHHLTYFYRQHEPFIGNYESNLRTIFQFRQRLRKNVYLDTFDAPDGNLHVGTRRPTTTSIQSLYFLNSPFVEEHASAIAKRVVDSTHSTPHRIAMAYELLFGREAATAEVQTVSDRLLQMKTQALGGPEDAIELLVTESSDMLQRSDLLGWTSMIRAMLCSNEFLFVD